MRKERSSVEDSSSSSSSDEANEESIEPEEENGESKVDRLLREAIDVLKKPNAAGEETSGTAGSSPAHSHFSDSPNIVDFFVDLKDKISHIKNRDEVGGNFLIC